MTPGSAMRGGRSLACAAVLFGAAGTAVDAAPAPLCHRSAEALVVSRERTSDVGQDIYVRRLPDPSDKGGCAYAPRRTDWRLAGKDDSFFFLALQGKTLALDSGTSPDRRLLIFDTVARKQIVATDYDDGTDRFSATPEAMTFWKVEPGAVKAEQCPAAWRAQPHNKTATKAHRTTEMRLTYADGKIAGTGATGCRLTQDDVE